MTVPHCVTFIIILLRRWMISTARPGFILQPSAVNIYRRNDRLRSKAVHHFLRYRNEGVTFFDVYFTVTYSQLFHMFGADEFSRRLVNG